MSPFMAPFRNAAAVASCLLLGEERKSCFGAVKTAFDPSATLPPKTVCWFEQQSHRIDVDQLAWDEFKKEDNVLYLFWRPHVCLDSAAQKAVNDLYCCDRR